LEIVLRQVEDLGDGTVILGVIREVTARRKAEMREAAMLADLQNAHSTLLRAQRVAHEGHWRLDAETHSMLCSGEVSRIFGLADETPKPATQSALQGLFNPLASDEQITMETMFARIHADERSVVEKEMRRALIEGGAFQSNFRVVQPDGSIRFVSCFAGPDQDSEGNTAGLIGTVQDVTERATQEQEQHHENKIRTIGRLASGVAHDFNNLLQSITSCLELIGDQLAQNGVASDYVRIALEASERGSYLTHHLLSYARKQILKPKRVLPEAMLRDMQVLLERTLGPHIKVQTQLSGHIPAIEVDPTHLQTALLNLGINSGHAMANGGTLTLEARIEDGPTPVVVMAVVDTGIGMDAATLAQATDPFFTTKGVMGTGLGLSMVNGFAQQSGGEMRITSRIGEGTRIELRLPAVLAREATPAAAAAIGDVRGHRVLLVEDASDVRITTSAFLVARSMSTVAVASGEEAIDQLTRGNCFDVMITDYAMPGIDGVETIRRARLLQHGLPAIIITGFANLEDVKTLPLDVQVLRKPFHRLDLLDAVTRAITHHSVAALAISGDSTQAAPAARG
jgi:signal transduction histidine kinase/ActR/RegA family two-component response regulator